MKVLITVVFAFLAILSNVIGGIVVTLIFLYGIYALFFISISNGFFYIGMALVGGFILQFLVALLYLISKFFGRNGVRHYE